MNVIIYRPELGPAYSRPRIGDKAMTLLQAMRRWRGSGFAMATGRERRVRAAICSVCPYWAGSGNLGFGECRAPGCGCTRAKIWLATEACPLGKWPSVNADA